MNTDCQGASLTVIIGTAYSFKICVLIYQDRGLEVIVA